MNRVRRVGPAGMGLMFALLSGCGFTPPKTVPVEGKVLFQGAPVANANLQFIPDPEAGGRYIANGTTDANGVFQLHTYLNETRTSLEGAGPGKYKVEVTVYSGARQLPKKYSSPTQTPLRADVPQGGAKTLTLQIEANP